MGKQWENSKTTVKKLPTVKTFQTWKQQYDCCWERFQVLSDFTVWSVFNVVFLFFHCFCTTFRLLLVVLFCCLCSIFHCFFTAFSLFFYCFFTVFSLFFHCFFHYFFTVFDFSAFAWSVTSSPPERENSDKGLI